MSEITKEIKNRILVLDGAMGTMLQAYKFTEEDFRGERFKDYPTPLQGNNDLLSITQPEAIKTIHGKYFEAGADIIETNTFSGTTIAMADYQMEDLVYELNYESAKIAKQVADKFTEKELIWIYEIARTNTVILDVFARPYALSDLKTAANFEGIVLSYQNSVVSQQLSAQLIFGAREANGKLPVTLGETFPLNTHYKTKSLKRLQYGTPESVGVNLSLIHI